MFYDVYLLFIKMRFARDAMPRAILPPCRERAIWRVCQRARAMMRDALQRCQPRYASRCLMRKDAPRAVTAIFYAIYICYLRALQKSAMMRKERQAIYDAPLYAYCLHYAQLRCYL